MKSVSLHWVPLLALAVCACAPPPANLEFSEAAALVFREFQDEEPAHLARDLRELEREIYLSMDVDASSPVARALTPDDLTEEDVAAVEHPPVPLDRCIAVAVSVGSKYEVDALAELPVMPDQLPFEPGSPGHYDRTFLEGQDCWRDRTCDLLDTSNEMTKDNAAISPITYILPKQYRWVDLNLPDPGGEGAPLVVNEGEPRWAIAARTWTTQRESNAEGDSIEQSYTTEVWIPRDGEGFVRSEDDENIHGGTWTGDSTGGGTLRMMAIWSQTIIISIAADDETIAAVTRGGIDDIFSTVEDWMDENRPL
jgi:hypothetical protein